MNPGARGVRSRLRGVSSRDLEEVVAVREHQVVLVAEMNGPSCGPACDRSDPHGQSSRTHNRLEHRDLAVTASLYDGSWALWATHTVQSSAAETCDHY